ncbi:hypothetical protein [Streptomyces sp. NBC_01217]|uniref:hypothetical protein n=1 Tax=Streptomyces sp. NBC_01217 TaxID=2903779 RepID=UPI002E1622B0|nr:hypothetical protein OG507_32815 [Streptomyces sp. NBC_01217]
MVDAVILGVGGLGCAALGLWFIRRQHRRHNGTRAGWGAMALGLSLIIRAAGFLVGSRQPFGLILALFFAGFSVGGYLLLAGDREKRRNGLGGRKRRKLPALPP